MPRLVWVDPNHPATKNQYITTLNNDPNVPAGYVLSNTSDGSAQIVDGKTDQNLQVYVGGQASGGYPIYYGYSDGLNTSKNPNGILGG